VARVSFSEEDVGLQKRPFSKADSGYVKESCHLVDQQNGTPCRSELSTGLREREKGPAEWSAESEEEKTGAYSEDACEL